MLDRVRRDLGLPDGTHVKAELHNMLVYGAETAPAFEAQPTGV